MGRVVSFLYKCAMVMTTRADKEFYSAHRASYRFGAQCTSHIRLTLHVPHEHRGPLCKRPSRCIEKINCPTPRLCSSQNSCVHLLTTCFSTLHYFLRYKSTRCGGWDRTTDLQVMSLTSYQAALPRDCDNVLYISYFCVYVKYKNAKFMKKYKNFLFSGQ